MRFSVDVVDTWNMTITRIDRTFTLGALVNSTYPAAGDAVIPLPSRPYMALRIERVK
jgi:hypothetical protein